LAKTEGTEHETKHGSHELHEIDFSGCNKGRAVPEEQGIAKEHGSIRYAEKGTSVVGVPAALETRTLSHLSILLCDLQSDRKKSFEYVENAKDEIVFCE
jgi:hypothetical protein